MPIASCISIGIIAKFIIIRILTVILLSVLFGLILRQAQRTTIHDINSMLYDYLFEGRHTKLEVEVENVFCSLNV